MILRRRLLTLPLLALVPAAGFPAAAEGHSIRVLFLGNSLTYVGNLPAVFCALCRASRIRCHAEMIVRGGATLADRVADRSLDRAADKGPFDYLILQERGGDLIAFPNEAAKAQAEKAADSLAQDARRLGMKPVLLGTYQPAPASDALVAAERALAEKIKAAYVPVSNYLECGKRVDPSLRWFQSDGMHPGPDLTLLMAVLLHRELLGSYPPAAQVDVRAPIYGTASGLTADTVASAQGVRPETHMKISYGKPAVKAIIALSRSKCG